MPVIVTPETFSLVGFDRDFNFSMVEVLFGADGSEPPIDVERPFSNIEINMAQAIFERVAKVLPLAFGAGGDTVFRFVDYARHVAARLGDRVAAITTHNEPWVMAVLGHESGIFAPGIRHRGTAMQVAHHLLLSHGLAVQALRADACRSRLGIVLNLSPIGPATDSPEDAAAAWLEDGRSVR